MKKSRKLYFMTFTEMQRFLHTILKHQGFDDSRLRQYKNIINDNNRLTSGIADAPTDP